MNLEQTIKTGITYSVALLTFANGTSCGEIPSGHIQENNPYHSENSITTFRNGQTIGSSVQMFIKSSKQIDKTIDSCENIIKDAHNQISNYDFIKVNDEVDKRIDAYFARRDSKKTKTILFKRS